jgi:chromosome segregation ATPase
MQQQIQGLTKDLDAAQHSVQTEEEKLSALESDKDRVMMQLGAVSNQLLSVQQQLGALQDAHSADQEQISTLRGQETALEMEKASLERQLNDLDSLRAQIRIVKRQLWAKKIEEWKRESEQEGIGGNKGMIMKAGQWQSSSSVGKPNFDY